MGGPASPALPQLQHQLLLRKRMLNNTTLSTAALNLIKDSKLSYTPFPEDKEYDLVYILKEDDYNPDLKMSLRSIDKFTSFRNIWLIGYKPTWVKNVNHLPTVQDGTKWQNAMINMLAACNCKDISDDFILMNDDFFALKPIINWKKELNLCLGLLEKAVMLYGVRKNKSRWQYGFEYVVDLLNSLNISNSFNYESHIPIIINKQKFIDMCNLPLVAEFMTTKKVLHRRSLYKNMYPDVEEPRRIRDVKITLGRDLNDAWLQESWLSVFDNVVDNVKSYPRANKFLNEMYPDKCRFEL